MSKPLVVVAVLLSSTTSAMDLATPRLFAITIELHMPNLEENLRYTTRHENRYLSSRDFATAFPALQDPALSDCHLVLDSPDMDRINYRLVCVGGHGTTGSASWTMGDNAMWGRLSVKLGGKNMTYSQTLTAVAIRDEVASE